MEMIKKETAHFLTLRDFLRFALSQFTKHQVYCGHGTASLEDEAWWLIAGALHIPLDAKRSIWLDAQLTHSEKNLLQRLIYERSILKIPTAYLLQQAYQQGYAFFVDARVLIPRSPIAELLLQRCEPWLGVDKAVPRILDLCTGSGVLAILSAIAFEEAYIDAVDISKDALNVAAENVKRHALEDRVKLIQADLWAGVKGERYDLIISNPPYVNQEDLAAMPAEYHHEPLLALAAGDDGLDIVIRILAEAKTHLNPQGVLIVEVGNSRPALEARFPHFPFIWLEFELGGEGVFLLNYEDLHAAY